MKHKVLLAGLCLVGVSAFAGDGVVRRSSKHIPGRYVVVLQSGADVAEVVGSVKRATNAKVPHSYERGVKGFALEGSEADAQKLARDPRVEFVEEDSVVTAEAITSSWALDRLDQRELPLNDYFYTGLTGAGVRAYVVDTGILATHTQFDTRVRTGFTAINDGRGSSDCNGHGTHVAGLLGGSTYGVAPGVTLVPVKVLDCNGAGSTSTVLAGLDYIAHHLSAYPARAVVNMSLSGPASPAIDRSVSALVSNGVITAVAAGNNDTDACKVSPARVASALTVGASSRYDEAASFSNYGPCVDLFAPGVDVKSAGIGSDNDWTLKSGTSSATPMAAGVAALYLERYPYSSAKAITQTVVSQASIDKLSMMGLKTPNRLLYASVGLLDQSIRGDNQLLADPTFDLGTTFWAADICTILNPTGCPPGLFEDYVGMSLESRSGKTHATLGGHSKSTVVTSETVAVPSGVRAAELSFYLWVVTKEKSDEAEDVLKVAILDAEGKLLETVGTFSNLDEGPTYTLRQIDLSRYAGKTVRISFEAAQDKGPSTFFLVDDVELNIWNN